MRSVARFAYLAAIQLILVSSIYAAEQEPLVTEADAIAAFERGKGLLASGEVDAAIQELERGTQSTKKEVLARANLARAYLAKGDTEEAAAAVKEALCAGRLRGWENTTDKRALAQACADQGFAWIVKREVLQNTLTEETAEDTPHDLNRVLEAAIEDFEKAIDLDPECFHAFRLMAWSQLTLGEYRKSIETCNAALALQPDCLDPLFLQGRCLP